MKNRKFFSILIFCFIGTGSAVHAANNSPLPFGINVHLSENEVLQKVKEAGIKWIRIDLLWSELEPFKGGYNFLRADRVIDFADQNDLSVLAVLGSTPDWANNGGGYNYPADNVEDWKNYIRIMVNRYKDRVKHWSIWNEPNLPVFFMGGRTAFLNDVFLPGIDSLKGADPEAQVVGPELGHLISEGKEWFKWLRYLLDHAGDKIDIVSHHIYESEGVEVLFQKLEGGEIVEGVEFPSVNQILEEKGSHYKPFWITETGWETWSNSEQQQADYYLQMLRTRDEKRYPDKIFFYEIIDIPDSEVAPWGILRSNLEEKPAYSIYKDFILENIDDPPSDNEASCFIEDIVSNNVSQKRGSVLLTRFRNFRDHVLLQSTNGIRMVKYYYSMEREFSRLCSSHPGLKEAVFQLLRYIDLCLDDSGRLTDGYSQNRKLPQPDPLIF